MSYLPISVEYIDPEENNRLYQVPVVCFDAPNDLVIIVHKKNFVKVKLSEVKFSRWDI
jgi:hypothetical protein